MVITKLTQSFELVAAKSRVAYFLTSLYYRMMVKREVELANINKNDKVLCIGGGFCPYTAILIHKYTDAKVTVIDNDFECIDKSREFLDALGLEGIEVRLCDGKHICCKDFTVVHIAMQVSPKEIVLSEIINRAQSGARVMVRLPKTIVENLYNRIYKGKDVFDRSVGHGFFSNVGNTCVCVVRASDAEDAA